MGLRVKRGAPTVWLLVKVTQAVDSESGKCDTARQVRRALLDEYLGGDRVAVRKLTQREKMALEQADATRPRKAVLL